MEKFRALSLLSLAGFAVCSCSPATTSLNSRSSVSNVQVEPVRVTEEGAQAFSRSSQAPVRSQSPVRSRAGKIIRSVRTTSYSCAEKELGGKYGRKNAIGITLKYGAIRSAAADWSRYPLGTKFRIVGEPYIYVIDDYGRALVGTDTIDIYKPNLSMMKDWGVRHIDIEVLEWGSYPLSLKILEGRKHVAAHTREMYYNIKPKVRRSSDQG